jgi:hypothetical protein
VLSYRGEDGGNGGSCTHGTLRPARLANGLAELSCVVSVESGWPPWTRTKKNPVSETGGSTIPPGANEKCASVQPSHSRLRPVGRAPPGIEPGLLAKWSPARHCSRDRPFTKGDCALAQGMKWRTPEVTLPNPCGSGRFRNGAPHYRSSVSKMVRPEVVATSPCPGKSRVPVCCGLRRVKMAEGGELASQARRLPPISNRGRRFAGSPSMFRNSRDSVRPSLGSVHH